MSHSAQTSVSFNLPKCVIDKSSGTCCVDSLRIKCLWDTWAVLMTMLGCKWSMMVLALGCLLITLNDTM